MGSNFLVKKKKKKNLGGIEGAADNKAEARLTKRVELFTFFSKVFL